MNTEYDTEELAPWFVLVLTLIGLGLRLYLISSRGYDLDEAFSIWVANQSVSELIASIARLDLHPPLYYLLLHSWIAINGDTPYYTRLLSALIGAATIPIIYLIGKRLSGAVVGLAAAVLLAFSPFNIRLAQETRMYTLLAFSAAVAVYALARLLTDARAVRPIGSQLRDLLKKGRASEPAEPDATREFSYQDPSSTQNGWGARIFSLRRFSIQAIETDLAWLAFIVFSAATLLSHGAGVLFPLAVNLFVLGFMLLHHTKPSEPAPAFLPPSLGNWVKAQFAIFLLCSPWLVPFTRQASKVYQEFWIPKPGWDTIIQALRSFLNENLIVQPSQVIFVWILSAGLLLLGLVYSRKRLPPFLFLVALFAIPFLTELIVSLRRPIFLDRTLIWTTLPLFLLLAAGIAQLKFRLLMLVVVGILATNNVFSTGDYYRFMQKEDWNNPAGYVAYYTQKDDLILFNAPGAQIPFDYYFKPFENQYSLQVEKHGVPVDLIQSYRLDPRMTDRDVSGLISLLSGRKRVWLIYHHNGYTDPAGLVMQTLASEMKLIQKRDYYGVQVQLYAVP